MAGSGALRAARVFPATGDAVLRDAVVAFSAGRLTYVGPAARFPAAVDLGDVTVLPGLIDAHAHLSMPADRRPYEEWHREDDETLVATGLANARRHLAAGVTTIRDNGARGGVGFAIRERVAGVPRVLACGRPLTPRGGHFHFCGGAADTPDEIRAAVRALAGEGADHIKIIASGGGTAGSSPHACTYGLAQLRAAVSAAHDAGLATTAHCRSTESLRRAVAAGIDCVEHLDFLPADPSRPSDVDYDAAVVAAMRDAGTYVSMTMQCGGYDTLRALSPVDHSPQRARLERYFANKLDVTAALVRDGLADRIALSTDAGPADTRFGRFAWGPQLAVAAGMSPAQALVAATRTPARLCGIADEVGTLTPGRRADLLVVAGDPTHAIADLERVVTVYVNGAHTICG